MPVFLRAAGFFFKEKDKKVGGNKKQSFAEKYKNQEIRENIIML